MEVTQQEDKMNPEVKAKWVAALRSGEYKQGSKYLNGPEGFCCLGVLCDLHAKEGLGKWGGHPETNGVKSYNTDFSILPTNVADWAGLSTTTSFGGIVAIRGNVQTLAHHNDSGYTFEDIAQAIEEQL